MTRLLLLLCAVFLLVDEAKPKVAVRLVDGKTPNEGRVEVRYKGTWGTICNDGYWDIWDAYVVCHMLNYSKAVTATTARVKGTGPIWLKGLDCWGPPESIDQCRHAGWGNTAGCDHSRDAGVVCGDLTPEEKAIKVRLVGDQNHTGKVEIQYQRTWGVVCDDWWDIRDAHVICRMLGYKAAEHAIRYIEGETTRRRLMSYVGCSGREKSIAECAHPGWWKAYCSNEDLAGVVCQTNEEEKAIKVRLVGDQNHTGKVEIQYNGTWGVVCDNYWGYYSWDIRDAHVICRMLGYKGAEHAIRYIEGETPRRRLMVNVGCSGREKSIAECAHALWWRYFCSNKRLAGVVCQTNEDPPPVQVRLAGGRSANSGRLEVRYHGQWGTVCGSGWDMKDAEVVCRMLGHPGVQEYITTNFTPVKGIIWLQYVGCTERETSIEDCSHNGWGNAYCYHSSDVGVTCKNGTIRATTQTPTTMKTLPLTRIAEKPTSGSTNKGSTEPCSGNFTSRTNCSKEDDGKKVYMRTSLAARRNGAQFGRQSNKKFQFSRD